MTARPKNNLDELKRTRSALPSTTTPIAPITPRSAPGKAKFRPAPAASSTPSGVTVRKLPSFSTPGFNKPKPPSLAPTAPSAADSSFSSIISISSTDTTPLHASTSSIPAKRISATFPDNLGPDSPPKRPKTIHSVDKENLFLFDSAPKGKGRLQQATPFGTASPISSSGLIQVHRPGPSTVSAHSNSIRSKAGAADLYASFEADLEEKTDEELCGVINTAQELIQSCDRQVGAARAGAGEPRDVALCDWLSDFLERRLSAAHTLRRAIQRGERPASGQTPSVSRQANSASQHVPPPVAQIAQQSKPNGSDTEDEYWADDAPLDIIAAQGPSAPATPPATQPRTLVPVHHGPPGPPIANPPTIDAAHLTQKPYYPRIIDALRTVFKLPSFRALQLEAICDVMEGRDVFVLFPTGSGKSLTYQLPAVCQDGLTVVVSPLTSLIHDQYRSLTERGVDVELLLGELPSAKKQAVQQRLSRGDLPKLLYLTPEMLQMNNAMMDILTRLRTRDRLRGFVIDEAHLITDWGRSFRDSYASLRDLRKTYPGVPISALTATASMEIRQDIISQLGLSIRAPYKLPFNRPNLDYEVRVKKKDFEKEIAAYIKERHPGESGIIYCSSRNGCEEVAMRLRAQNINAMHFHASMDSKDKARIQERWNSGEFQVIVATIAFGMGIDKSDVRFVIHHSPPTSLNRYYQETGRAGRDGKPSYCILYHNQGDFNRAMDRIHKEKDISDNERRAQQEALRIVMRYCINDVRCRRQQVITFFGDDFDPADCHQLCDNCRNQTPYITEDHTADVQNAVRLFEDVARRKERLTAVQLASALKGSRSKDLMEKGVTDSASHGACSHLTKGIIDRLVDEMCYAGIFTSQPVGNSSGYSNSYLVVTLPARSRRQL
ncbi:P-loop containing nucleoside triphosphate hydrolase protein [Trametes gibbosa]|nr:P-loop containing nucleoside triphosphate hydrolase protein [Trametes gibbosa]